MILDIILAAILFVWAVFGYRKGFVHQIFTLVGILLVVFVSAPMADMLEKILTQEFNMHFAGRYMRGILLSVSGAILYIISYIAGRFLHHTLVKGISVAEKTNHILGTVLALIQAILIIYFILCLGAWGHVKIQEYAPAIYQNMIESKSYTIAENYNILEHYDFFESSDQKESIHDTNAIHDTHKESTKEAVQSKDSHKKADNPSETDSSKVQQTPSKPRIQP